MSYTGHTVAATTLILCLCGGTGAAESELGILELSIVDADGGCEVPARVRVRDRYGKDHIAPGCVSVPIAEDIWFAYPGRARLELPAGAASIRVERGTEYRPVVQEVEIAAGRTTLRKIRLERWIDMFKRGYSSGENHLHVSCEDLPAMLAAEGMDFGTSLSWWNGPKMEVGAERGCMGELQYEGAGIACSVCDAEVEHSWGAVYLIGLQSSLNIPSDKRRSNLPYVRTARDQGALVCYQAGWSREVLMDALLGYVDVVNVCNNNFHRHKYQPRRRYSNLLDVDGFPEYAETPEGMLEMNQETYYRLLNCGLRLAAGAGSATGAKTTPIGYNRAYVRAGADPTLGEFLEAWRAGRNFVTNGPMLFLRTRAGQQPGDTIALPAKGETVSFEAEAKSEQPLRSLEIVANGKVIGKADIGNSGSEARLSVSLKIEEGMWVAARCTEEDQLLSDEELDRYSKGGSLPEKPCRLRYAHTSPVYITIGGKGARVASSVREAEAMLKSFERFARDTAADRYLEEILKAMPKEVAPVQE